MRHRGTRRKTNRNTRRNTRRKTNRNTRRKTSRNTRRNTRRKTSRNTRRKTSRNTRRNTRRSKGGGIWSKFRREPSTEVQYDPVSIPQPSAVTPSTHNMISRSEGSSPTSEESNPSRWKRSGAIFFPQYKLAEMVDDLLQVQVDKLELPTINATPEEKYGEFLRRQRIARQGESENTARVIDSYYAPNYGGKMKQLYRPPERKHWFYG